MENRRAVVAAALIAILVAGLIVGMVMFLGNIFKSQTTGPAVSSSSAPSSLPITSGASPSTAAPRPTVAPRPPAKYLAIANMTLTYPVNWGLLKCSNSTNIEFDPYILTDQTMVCDFAAKAITVLVETPVNCQGETVTLGASRVVRSKTVDGNGVNYRWCVFGPAGNLDITHRVANDGSRATSKDDFSVQVEQMITSLKVGAAS